MQPSRTVVQRVENTTRDIAHTVDRVEEQVQDLTTTVQSLYERVTTENPTVAFISIGVVGGLLLAKSTNNRTRRRNQTAINNTIGEIANGLLAITSGIGLGFLGARVLNP